MRRKKPSRLRHNQLDLKLFATYASQDFTITTSGVPIAHTYSYKLSDCYNYERWADNYDEFRINKVVTTFEWFRDWDWSTCTPISTYPGIQYQPTLFWNIDHDGTSAAASVDELRQRDGIHEYQFRGNYCKKSIAQKPAMSVALYEGVSSWAYTPKFGIWVDTKDAAAPWYGLATQIHTEYPGPAGFPESPARIGCIKVKVTYYVSFRKVKASADV